MCKWDLPRKGATMQETWNFWRNGLMNSSKQWRYKLTISVVASAKDNFFNKISILPYFYSPNPNMPFELIGQRMVSHERQKIRPSIQINNQPFVPFLLSTTRNHCMLWRCQILRYPKKSNKQENFSVAWLFDTRNYIVRLLRNLLNKLKFILAHTVNFRDTLFRQ